MIDINKIKRRESSNTEYVGARISKDDKKWLERFCEEQAISMSGLICELIKEFIDSKKSTKD